MGRRKPACLDCGSPGMAHEPQGPGISAGHETHGTPRRARSEEHTSELQSLMRISYAVFCLKKKKVNNLRHRNGNISDVTTKSQSCTHTTTKNETYNSSSTVTNNIHAHIQTH